MVINAQADAGVFVEKWTPCRMSIMPVFSNVSRQFGEVRAVDNVVEIGDGEFSMLGLHQQTRQVPASHRELQ
ncbi:MAG: hypothetical protein U0V48_19145 [Anaerolineales bacterium]